MKIVFTASALLAALLLGACATPSTDPNAASTARAEKDEGEVVVGSRLARRDPGKTSGVRQVDKDFLRNTTQAQPLGPDTGGR
jgi:hypothetical protein